MVEMNKWEVAILKIIAANDGTASLKHVYGKLPSYVDLTDNHYEITYKAPAYHHQTRAHVDDLLDKGELYRAKRGVYSITLKGRSRMGIK
jgi:hypothetical protein